MIKMYLKSPNCLLGDTMKTLPLGQIIVKFLSLDPPLMWFTFFNL